MATVAICGNFQVIYCTEAELAWTLEDMGHTVIRLQENHVSTEDMWVKCQRQEAQLFLYIHTHGWKTPGSMTMERLFDRLRDHGVKLASFHLDQFWGLEKGDQRQSRIGTHAFWKTDTVFSPDGGHQQEFADRGVNHVWSPPGVAKRHCFRGQPKPEYKIDVAFVGSKGYHQEYPFRVQLIAWLEKTYVQRFRRFGGDAGGVVRESKLNDLYASAKVVVGDSCFGGAPRYWSDRVPETLGRGGFLLHPRVEGLNISGLITFEPQKLSQLKEQIDYYVTKPDERKALTDMAMADVRANHTYHNRMQTVLETMGVL